MSRKSANSSFVYHSRPMPPSDSTVLLPTTLNLPEPAICQPSSVPLRRENAPGPGAGIAFCTFARAVRRTSVYVVRDGFAYTTAGKLAVTDEYANVMLTQWITTSLR